MLQFIDKYIRPIWHRLGFDIRKYRDDTLVFPPDFDDETIAIWKKIHPYTLTGKERVYTLVQAVKHLVEFQVEGAMVECGIWKGGSSMAIALTLQNLGISDRDLYMYDTYTGMAQPTEIDVSYKGGRAVERFDRNKISDDVSAWCFSPLEEVTANLHSTGYNKERLHFIQGKVEETIPETIPEKIALLRLDTDFYESTKHEMEHLYPLIEPNGIIIIDDYGHWQGSRIAVDEYIAENNIQIFLNRVDYTARLGIKPAA